MRKEHEGIDYNRIYDSHASKYDLLVSREDYSGNLLPALEDILPLFDISVIELGAGTGRLTRLLSPHVSKITALDKSFHMLDFLGKSIHDWNLLKCILIQADNRELPLRDDRADLVVAGWTISHLVGWYPEDWRLHVDAVLEGMERVARPDGTVIVVETLGTGRESPLPPTPGLADYYAHLENQRGFSGTWIRTDYLFDSLEEAIDLVRFFFGETLANQVIVSQSPLVPECTGIWWKRC